jgi:glycosyltransferase involved in cell wall biosynthesis
VHVITRLIVGGAQLTAIGLCEEMSDAFDLTLVSGVETGPEGSLHELAEKTVPVRYVTALRRGIEPHSDVFAVARLRKLLEELNPHIVHTHSSKAGVIGRLAAHRTGVRLVHTVHGWGHTPADPGLRRRTLIAIERGLARRTDALVAVSEDVRVEGEYCGIGTPGQYVVIPELVHLKPHDQDFVSARARALDAVGLNGSAGPVLGWVGRFVPQKDPAMLAEVLNHVLTELPDVCAVLIGDGPLRRDVERSVAEAGIGERVRFAGLRADARALYAAMDVVVHPSLWEGQPRVVQEALAERVPVVATRVAGVPELVRNGINGFVVRPQDVAGMARAVIKILTDPTLRAPLDLVALEPLQAVAGAERCVERHKDLYAHVLALPSR